MATKEDLTLAQVTALVRLNKKLKSLPTVRDGKQGTKRRARSCRAKRRKR